MMRLLVFVAVLFYQYVISNCQGLQFPDYANHPCKRVCIVNDKRTCHYNFTIETIFTMETSCGNCPTNVTDCFNKGCIVADGKSRPATVINRMMPGPPIQVCLGDEIVVAVTNGLVPDSLTIHWHGMHQKGTPYMDGVPSITQCPIHPGQTFYYNFIADHAGTNLYHSHTGTQRINGVVGALIVLSPCNYHRALYDLDLPEHVIIPWDWFLIDPQSFVETYHRTYVFNPMVSGIMVNGRMYDGVNNVPPSRFYVKAGLRYRFRIIHNGALVCPLEIKIDGHNMTLISTDGSDVRPVVVNTVTITAGERIDVIINANQVPGKFWMQFKGLFQCENRTGYAILQYDNSTDLPSPPVPTSDGMKFNCLNEAYGGVNCTQYTHLHAMVKMEDALNKKPDLVYYIGLDMLPGKEKAALVKPGSQELIAELLNNISSTFPLPNLYEDSSYSFCNRENALYNSNFFAECPHGIVLPYRGQIEIVFVDQGSMKDMAHPMHLHGYSYRVVGEGRINDTVTVQQIKDMNDNGLITKNLVDAPEKDTISVVDGGYTVIRFIADNKGFWFLHCHIELHAESGMSLVVKTGDFNINKIPKSFPKCGNYKQYNKIRRSRRPKFEEACLK